MDRPQDATRYNVAVDPSAANNPHAFALAMVGSGKRVLEIGCSAGHVSSALVAAGNDVVGVEIDPEAAALAAPVLQRVHILDIARTPLSRVETERFDVLLLGDVLEHLGDPAPVLEDMLTLLEDGGFVVISVPNVSHVDVRLMLLEGRWEYQDDGLLDRTHVHWFTRENLRRLLADCGLVATQVERVVVGPGGSNVPAHLDVHDPRVLEFVQADPEWQTYQFVVRAERDSGQPDALAGEIPNWPARAASTSDTAITALAEQNAALQAEVDAWRKSRVVRYSAPMRRLVALMRSRRGWAHR